MERKSYPGIDLGRFLCALLIVCIHAAPFGTGERFFFANFLVQQFLARVAVPFFFIASGFFLYRKSFPNGFDWAPTGQFLRKMLRLYLIWSLLYFPFKLEIMLGAPNGIVYACVSALRDLLFVGFYGHLWYLHAAMVGAVLVSFLLKKGTGVPVILSFSFALYLLGLLVENWVSLIEPLRMQAPRFWMLLHLAKKVLVTSRNGIFEGFFYISVGMLFARCRWQPKLSACIAGFLVSLALLFCEVGRTTQWGHGKIYDLYLFAAPASSFLFAIALQWNRLPAMPALRILSALLFYLHPMVILLLNKLTGFLGVDTQSSGLHFLLTLTISLGLSQMICRLSQTGCPRLKTLYS